MLRVTNMDKIIQNIHSTLNFVLSTNIQIFLMLNHDIQIHSTYKFVFNFLYIKTIKDEFTVTFVSLIIIVYSAILDVNLTDGLHFGGRGPPVGVLQF
jgi:hypothetical protein